MSTNVGRVQQVWRYPVSSAAGERRQSLPILATGPADDRRFAMVDAITGETAAPERQRRWQPAPLVRSRMIGPDEPELAVGPGPFLPAWSADASDALSRHFGFAVEVRRYGPAARGEPVAKHRYRPGPVHLLTSASVGALHGALPRSCLDVRRFRPNVLVETSPSLAGAVEQGWIGREVQLGGVRLAVSKPCGRCSFTTLVQQGFPLDRDVLRALIRDHDRQFGVLCHVVVAGEIAEGDPVSLL